MHQVKQKDQQSSHSLSKREEFTARYLLETPGNVERLAETIAGEQSSGTFARVPDETPELQERARARILSINSLNSDGSITLPSAFVAREAMTGKTARAVIELGFPTANVGNNLPTLLATVAGNLFELGEVTGLRLLDIDVPASFAASFNRPRFSIEGTRELAGVHGTPFIGTIIKPSVGLSPQQTANLVNILCAADIDFIKDDELMANPPHSPIEARISEVMPVIARHADRLGRKVMYAFNISGPIDHMRRAHDLVLEAGGTCVMVSLNWVGVAGVEAIARHTQLPLHGHRNGWGMFTRCEALGISFAAYQKIWRLAGVDHLHVNGIDSKFWEPNESVIASARACLTPFADVPAAMPIVSSGQWGGQAPATYAALGNVDLMYLAGGGILAHPGGPAEGVTALREAWEAAVAGVDLESYAETHPPLRKALRAFGPKRGGSQ